MLVARKVDILVTAQKTVQQLENVNTDNAIVIITQIDPNAGGTPISLQDYAILQ